MTATMTSDEIDRELCAAIQADDREAAGQLLEKYKPLVFKEIQKYRQRRPNDVDDMVQVATLAILEAAKRFDMTRTNKFITYAIWYVRGRVMEFLKRSGVIATPCYDWNDLRVQKARNLFSLDTTLGNSTGPLLEILAAREPTEESDEETNKDIQRLNEAIARLPKNRRTVIRGRMKGLSNEQLGGLMGLSKQRIQQIEIAALKALKERLGQ